MAARESADARESDARRRPQPRPQCMCRVVPRTPEETEQTGADPQEEPRDQEGGGGERKLQREPEQEAGLEDGVERETLGAQQPLDQLLRAVGKQGKKEEAAGADAPAFTTAHSCEQRADTGDPDERRCEAEHEHRVAGEALAGALVEAADVASVPRCAFTPGGGEGVADEMGSN